ncbi:MAG: zf-TFIIB domain-containing protein, partial [Myxococcales bacterium]|nr:zf-TFIIB domain-containing protein [Myxococcales bacterium]
MSGEDSTETRRRSVTQAEIRVKREEAQRRHAGLDEDERKRLKDLHWMHCPKCGDDMAEVQFRGVQIDKCFACGGVYLDDGELEQ